jgi:signal transduction histidine kinase
VPLAFQIAVRRALRAPKRRRALTMHVTLSLVLGLNELAAWLLTGAGQFWPLWPLLGQAVLFAAHVWIQYSPPGSRERQLADRVDVLTRTRSGVLDAGAAELKRIERDLHDGTQARLVSVAMSLGLAEELLGTDREPIRDLLAEARSNTLTAIEDLRTVMKGIQPPVLADRGLDGAIRALALGLAVPVTVTGGLPGQAPAPVESAVYFAAAECLANVVKHSGAVRATANLGHDGGVLTLMISDDGIGGASLDDGGGLVGIARRLMPFDGTLTIASPAGGPTTVRMEVPCELSSPRT